MSVWTAAGGWGSRVRLKSLVGSYGFSRALEREKLNEVLKEQRLQKTLRRGGSGNGWDNEDWAAAPRRSSTIAEILKDGETLHGPGLKEMIS